MFSELIKNALEQEVVGQPHAVNSVVRGVTRLVSGLTPTERSWCAYLFIGPPGTGRAHLVRSLARALHGQEAVHTVNCNPGGHSDPWLWFVQQLAPLFESQQAQPHTTGSRPPSIVLVQDLECANKELFPILARVLEAGQLALPGGRSGRLTNCLIFITSGLCTAEILETDRLGFTGIAPREDDGEEKGNIVEMCREEAEKVFGLELLAQLDNMVVFRRLEEEHLASVLESHFGRMARWLGQSGIQCEMLPGAKAFLLECGSRQKLLGARDLIVAHRREVEFPLADLLLSSRLQAGTSVIVDHEPGEEHLHFTVGANGEGTVELEPVPGIRSVHDVGVSRGVRVIPVG